MKKLVFVLVFPCLLIGFVQVGLANPATREMFTRIDDYERQAEIIEAQQNKKYVLLSMEEGIPSEGITVYVNSRPAIRFVGRKMKIPAEYPGVVEIRNDTNSVVTIYAESDDYIVETFNTSFPRGIKSLCRIS